MTSFTLRATAWLFVVVAPFAQPAWGQRIVPLLDDTRFERGLIVLSPVAGRKVPVGKLASATAAEPLWELGQWHSRFSLADAKSQPGQGGATRYFDGAKAVTFFPSGSPCDISLALNSFPEYRDKWRGEGDAWPHLLVERSLLARPRMPTLRQVRFAISYRLSRAVVRRTDGYDVHRHAAQFLFFVTVQNHKTNSPGRGDYLWFGVPMYDSRDRSPKPHMAKDVGSDRKPATGKFIYMPGGDVYTPQSAHDGQWVTIDKDLLPLLRRALQTAWDRGFLQDSRDAADYGLGEMNMGWEVTGLADVEMQVKGLRLTAEVAD